MLGTSAVSPLDMASGYSTFMNNGEHVNPVVGHPGDRRERPGALRRAGKRERVLDQDITDQVSWDLSGVITNGTGTGAEFGQPAAGKTGTTQDHRDAWFVGYTCSLTAAVWNGFVDNQPMDDVRGKVVFGGTYAAPIWGKFMAKATQGLESCPYDRPDDVSGRVGDLANDTGTTVRSGSTTTTGAERARPRPRRRTRRRPRPTSRRPPPRPSRRPDHDQGAVVPP